MFEISSFSKVFATGPDYPLENKNCFYCMFCRRNISMRTRGLYELKRQYQKGCHLRVDQIFREQHCLGKVRGRDRRMLYESKQEAESDLYMELDVPNLEIWITQNPSIMMFWKPNQLHLQQKSLVCGSKSFCL